MSQMHIPNIKQRVEPGQFNTMWTWGLLDTVPKIINYVLLPKEGCTK